MIKIGLFLEIRPIWIRVRLRRADCPPGPATAIKQKGRGPNRLRTNKDARVKLKKWERD